MAGDGHPREGNFCKFREIRWKLLPRVRLRAKTHAFQLLFDMNCEFLTAAKNRSGGPQTTPTILGNFIVWISRYWAGNFLVRQL